MTTTRKAGPAPAAATPAGVPGRAVAGQLVAAGDGPLAGQWFTWADWRARLDAARHVEAAGGRRSPVLDYLPAGHQLPHPDPVRYPGTFGQAASYRPGHAPAPAPASGPTAPAPAPTAAAGDPRTPIRTLAQQRAQAWAALVAADGPLTAAELADQVELTTGGALAFLSDWAGAGHAVRHTDGPPVGPYHTPYAPVAGADPLPQATASSAADAGPATAHPTPTVQAVRDWAATDLTDTNLAEEAYLQ